MGCGASLPDYSGFKKLELEIMEIQNSIQNCQERIDDHEVKIMMGESGLAYTEYVSYNTELYAYKKNVEQKLGYMP